MLRSIALIIIGLVGVSYSLTSMPHVLAQTRGPCSQYAGGDCWCMWNAGQQQWGYCKGYQRELRICDNVNFASCTDDFLDHCHKDNESIWVFCESPCIMNCSDSEVQCSTVGPWCHL